MYEERFYRKEMGNNLDSFLLVIEETDLWIGISKGFFNKGLKKELEGYIISYRKELKSYLEIEPEFANSLVPYLSIKDAPDFARRMSNLSLLTDVGPMAGVAGAFSLIVGKYLKNKGIPEIIVENGGDIYVYGIEKLVTGIYAGESPFSNKINLEIFLGKKEFGISSSSGSFGHSLSFGKADIVTIISENVILSDLMATSICNKVKKKEDINNVIIELKKREEITGALIIMEDKLGAYGNFEIKGRS